MLKTRKMGSIVIYYHVNIIGREFKLDQQGLNEFVHSGHKGLTMQFHSSGLSSAVNEIPCVHSPHSKLLYDD